MKVTVQMNVYNAEDYLFYSLSSIYDFADRIVIIDGAFNERMPTPFSTDRTGEIIEGFPDKEKKIVYRTTSSKTQIEQRNKGLEYAIGDWLFLVDYDEVHKKKELSKTKDFLAKAQEDAYYIRAYVFVNSFYKCFETLYPRAFRLKEGIKFSKVNALEHSQGEFSPRKPIPDLVMYHYSWIPNVNRLLIKRLQGKHELPEDFRNGQYIIPRARIKDNHPWGIKSFKGKHPLIMEKHPYLEKEIGRHRT